MGTALAGVSLPGAAVISPSGQLCGLSGMIVGDVVDLKDGNTNCNIFILAKAAAPLSGAALISVQTSPDTTSGNFTDPTSGYAVGDLPSWISSGGIFRVGASGYPDSAANVASGAIAFGHFVRPHRYARLTHAPGTSTFVGAVTAGFITNKRTIGSGGGFSFSPSSGSVSV